MAGRSNLRYKAWCFTLYSEDAPTFNESKMEYLCYGREVCPTTNRRHIQGYVSFKVRQRFSCAKTLVPGAHLERARGSSEENYKYCSKDGDFTEFGTRPSHSGRVNPFHQILAAAETGDLDTIKETYPGIYLRYKNSLETLYKRDTAKLTEPCGVWIFGAPGTGKDFSVFELFGEELYVENINKWWDGYVNQNTVLISDVEPSHSSFLGYFLKIWADIYPFNAEVKGSSMKIRPKRVVVTSNFKIEQVFTGSIFQAIWRRFDKIYFD